MTGRTVPASSSGQTCACSARRNRALLRDRPRAQRRTGQRQPALHHRDQVERGLDAAEHRDLHEPSIHRQHVQVPRQVVAADHVEDDVDASAAGRFADGRDEVGLAVVDGALGAQAFAGGALLRRSGRGEHARPTARASWIAVVPMPLDPP